LISLYYILADKVTATSQEEFIQKMHKIWATANAAREIYREKMTLQYNKTHNIVEYVTKAFFLTHKVTNCFYI
jgi:hypothetical protein